jgi:DNA topoisomerase-1
MPSKKTPTDTRSRKLVIVESPTKAKTISRFLDHTYLVEASMGHIRDLPKSRIGIDVEHGFEPSYTIPKRAKPVVEKLKEEAENADEIILATDGDREGEAISWHLLYALGIEGKKKKKTAEPKTIKRIIFHEITEAAIKRALEHPGSIDMNLVDAQQARRVLDRLVGYELSPFLWRKIRYGLSAGRVQSVALRLIVERDREIQAFVPQEYWSVEGDFSTGRNEKFSARLIAIDGKTIEKFEIGDASQASGIVSQLENASYTVSAITKKEVNRSPAPPFTTSTLQQEAARKFGFSAKQTMMIAQSLYENGFITYMRTDSLNLAESALAQIKDSIRREFGDAYLLSSPRHFANRSKGAQEAHEAIRPTGIDKRASDLPLTDRGAIRLYDLIWKRTIACQMASAVMEQTAADLTADTKERHTFRANGQVVIFDGFIKAYTEGKDEEESADEEGILPKLDEGEAVSCLTVRPEQHFTIPPPRFTDATLIKALESAGIGRPSTYAPTLSTIQERGYVEKEEKKYKPTEIGYLVNDMLVEHFPEIVDVNFTSHIEEELDDIAEGKTDWTEVCREFYEPFKKHLVEKEKEVEKQIEVSETPCPHCGKMMIIKFGRNGKFLACPDPESKVTKPMPEEEAMIKELEAKTKGELCPLCGLPMDVKKGRFGYFLGCSNYPACKGVAKIWNKTGFKCPNCLRDDARKEKPGDIVEKKGRGRGKPFYACTRFPDCEFVMSKKPETQAEVDEGYAYWKENPPSAKKPKYAKKTRI